MIFLFLVGTDFLFSKVSVGSWSVKFDTDPAQLFIRIQRNDTDPADPDPQHWWWVSGPVTSSWFPNFPVCFSVWQVWVADRDLDGQICALLCLRSLQVSLLHLVIIIFNQFQVSKIWSSYLWKNYKAKPSRRLLFILKLFWSFSR